MTGLSVSVYPLLNPLLNPLRFFYSHSLRTLIHPQNLQVRSSMLRSVMLLLVFSLAGLSSTLMASTTEYRIENMKGNVWRFTAGPYHSAFMVTDDGIFVTDPISTDAARWLKTELKKRFHEPIRYMAYSHSHPDHAQGGQVIDDNTVTVIAHELADEDFRMTQLPTALPELMFKDDLRINLGDSSVELKYHGTNNGRGNVSMRFMPANVMYVVDWIVIGRMPYKDLIGYDINGMIHSTRDIVQAEPFDLLIGGHANTGTQEDVANYLGYLEALYAAVRDGMLAPGPVWQSLDGRNRYHGRVGTIP